MTGAILMLGIVVFGLLIIFGQADVNRFYKLVIFLIAGPILVSIALGHIQWFWEGLPGWGQLVALMTAPFLLAAVLKAFFPRPGLIGQVFQVLFDTVVYAVTFPFRLVWRSGRLLFGRERHHVRLDPRRSVVGGRPPVLRHGPEDRRND